MRASGRRTSFKRKVQLQVEMMMNSPSSNRGSMKAESAMSFLTSLGSAIMDFMI